MGSREANPKKPPSPPQAPETDRDVDAAPSSTKTSELPAMTAEKLIASSAETGSDPRSAAAPQDTSSARMADDLEQTIEAPSAFRVAILDAAEKLIIQVGFADLNEQAIANAANVTLDVFRAHFGDRTALLRALNDRFCAQALTLIDDSTRSGIWDHSSANAIIEVAVRSILDVVLTRAPLVRAVLASCDEDLLDAFREIGTHVTTKVNRVIAEMGEDNPPAPRDVAFAFLIAVSLAHQAIMIGTHWAGIEVEREELHERTTRAVRAYLASLRPRPS
jgi:AcrR family transcriptional regulator